MTGPEIVNATAPASTYYEVAWGIEANERQTYIDNGDGSLLSVDAGARATRAWLNLVKEGVKAGFFVNGQHEAGHDFGEEWASVTAEDAATSVEHKTSTFLYSHGSHMNWRKVQIAGDRHAWAVCVCGWKTLHDNRDLARRAARRHREVRQELVALAESVERGE